MNEIAYVAKLKELYDSLEATQKALLYVIRYIEREKRKLHAEGREVLLRAAGGEEDEDEPP